MLCHYRIDRQDHLVLFMLIFTSCCLISFVPEKIDAQITVPDDSALRLAPESAACFVSISNVEHQLKRVLSSQAFSKIIEYTGGEVPPSNIDFWQMFHAQAVKQLEDDPEFKEWYSNPQNKELYELGFEITMSEMFFYFDEDICDQAEQYKEANLRYAKQLSESGFEDLLDGNEQAFADSLGKALEYYNVKSFKVPTFVAGFKLSDVGRAQRQLDRLPPIAKELLSQFEGMNDRVSVETFGAHKWVTLQLKGSDIPWDTIELENNDQRAAIEQLKPLIEGKRLSLAAGIVDQYLIVSIGSSLEHIENFGKVKSLYEHPRLSRVKSMGQTASCATVYMSDRFAKAVFDYKPYFEVYGEMIGNAIGSDALTEEAVGDIVALKMQELLATDVKEFVRDLSEFWPEPGATLSHVAINETGYVGFFQSWAENKFLDTSKQLDVLKHVGGAPLCVFAGRNKHRPQDFDVCMKWVRKLIKYVEVTAKGEEMGAETLHALKKVKDLVSRFELTMKNNWIPNRTDEQAAFVVDDQLKTRRPFPTLPRSERRLPVPEIAVVYAINDPEKIEAFGNDIIEMINECLAAIMEASGEEQSIPVKIPNAEFEQSGDVRLYFYPIGSSITGSSELEPTAGMNNNWLAFALSQRHAKQLINPIEPQLGDFMQRFKDRELGAVCYLDFEGMSKMAEEWVIYGFMCFQSFIKGEDYDASADEELMEFAEATNEVMSLIRCLKSFAGATYSDSNSIVFEFELRFQDIDE